MTTDDDLREAVRRWYFDEREGDDAPAPPAAHAAGARASPCGRGCDRCRRRAARLAREAEAVES